MEGLFEDFFDVPCALRLDPASGSCTLVLGTVVKSESEAVPDFSALDDPAVFAVDSEWEPGCSLLDDSPVFPAGPEVELDCSVLGGPRILLSNNPAL